MSTEGRFFVYVLASRKLGTLYVGVSSNLIRRTYLHREDILAGFTRRYGVHRLVYFEQYGDPLEAIRREKQLKKWNRAWKVELIEKANPDWDDLWYQITASGP